jgi:hypothetical protein
MLNSTEGLTQKDIGRWMIYTPPYSINGEGCIKGRLKQYNASYCFVVFKCDGNWLRYWEYTGVCCSPRSLEFETFETNGLIKELERGEYEREVEDSSETV